MNLRPLIGKLNARSRESLEAAVVLCVSRGNYSVEIEHWLCKLLDLSDTDFDLILRSEQVDKNRVHRDVNRALDSLKGGNTRNPTLSPSLVRLIREAWLAATIEFGRNQIRTGDLLFALIADAELNKLLNGITPQLSGIAADGLAKRLPDLAIQSSEHTGASGRADVRSVPLKADDFVFVSYHRGDQEFVFWLAEELRKKQVDLWIDHGPSARAIIGIGRSKPLLIVAGSFSFSLQNLVPPTKLPASCEPHWLLPNELFRFFAKHADHRVSY